MSVHAGAPTKLLTAEETAAAKNEGWGLFHLYELDTKRWVITALALGEQPKTEMVLQYILAKARERSPLHTKAAQLMFHSTY